MAASIIRKSDINELVQYAVGKVQNWTAREVFNVTQNEKKPICIPVKDKGYVVGKFLVEKLDENEWKVYDTNDEVLNNFYFKSSAILYSACLHINKIELAKDILLQDNLYARIKSDVDMFHTKVQQHTKLDEFKRDLFVSRYINSKLLHNDAYKKLRKMLNRAKYLQTKE